jgi:hypothetical protein
VSRIKKGDLVCAFRRKSMGFGIVLEYVDDIDEAVYFPAEKTLQEFIEIEEMNYLDKLAYIEEIAADCHTPREKTLSKVFFTYNRGWKQKIKKKFAYVYWFEPPSNYYDLTNKFMRGRKEWYPAEWLRSKKSS